MDLILVLTSENWKVKWMVQNIKPVFINTSKGTHEINIYKCLLLGYANNGRGGEKKENRMNIELSMTRMNTGLLERNDTSQIYETSLKKSFNLWSERVISLTVCLNFRERFFQSSSSKSLRSWDFIKKEERTSWELLSGCKTTLLEKQFSYHKKGSVELHRKSAPEPKLLKRRWAGNVYWQYTIIQDNQAPNRPWRVQVL